MSNKETAKAAFEIRKLPCSIRFFCVLVGFVAIVCGGLLVYHPPQRKSSEILPNAQSKITVSDSDQTTVAVTAIGIGALLMIFGLNGLQITKLAAGQFGFDTAPPNEENKAKEYFSAKGEDLQPPAATGTELSPEPVEPSKTVLDSKFGKFEGWKIYGLQEIPQAVITDLINNWPKPGKPPDDFSGFEFAARKPGKGNNPWFIRFKGMALWVSYGCQGKKGASIDFA